MKKFTLILVAMLFSALSFAAQPKRIYAYDLSSALVDKVYTFSFTANETPTSGKIIFYDATSSELVGEIALTNPVLGKNEVEIAEYSLPGNDGQPLNWAVELSAAAVTAFEAVYTGAKKYGRGHATIDNSPESNYFGRVYVTDRRKTDTSGGLYVYTPSLQLVSNDVYKLGRSRNGYSRPAVAADGTLFLADYTDADRSGIYVVDPSNLTTCTQFYDGTRASNGLFTNTNGEEIGSSTSGVGVFGAGANMVLYTMMEDGSYPSAAVSYHIGQPDGSILKSWSDLPTWICKEFSSINVSTNNAFAATEKGVWISQNDAVAVGSRAELVFIDKNGTLQFQQDKQMCNGAGLAVNADNSKLYISGSNNIVEYNITWNGNKPTLELSETYSISYAQVSTLSLDYAGNLIACAGASYGSTDSDVMLIVQYTLPTANNTCEVPAKKADVVTKVEAAVALYTVTTNVNNPAMGSVSGNLGTYEDGASAELTAEANEHYEFVNWTYGSENSTANPLILTVNSDLTITANFQEHAKYTITASAADNTMGYVTGGNTYYEGETVTLKAVAKTGYYFTGWDDSNTDNPRTFTATEDVTLQANFAVAYPRVYAYDLDVVDNGDSYTFSFKPNTNAVSGNLLLYNEEGTAVVQTHAITTAIVAHTATSIILNKTELPNQADVPWAIQLSGNPIPAFAETFADADYRFAKGHAAVDNSPESEYFGRVYVADRRSTKSKSGFYVYNIDFTPLNTEANKLGMDKAGYSRPAVGADGTVYLTGYTDDESGIFVVDPADLTKCTQFYNGTRASNGLFTNGGAELGSSTSGVGAYGVGKDAVLYSMMEDGTGANANSGKQPIVKYQIGQSDGTVLKQWSTAPTWHINYPATGKDSYNFGNNAFAATEKGVWISQNKSNDADRPEIAFIDKEGVVQFMQNLNKSQGGGLAVNADNTVLYLQKAGEILEYNITWTGNTPALTLAKAYPVSLQYITTLSFDYAGNLIACAGTQYGSNTDNNVMKLVAYTLPTNDNTCTVPAAKAKALKLGVRYNVEVTVNDPAMGTVTGAGEYKENETAILTATPAEHHRFVNWTKGAEIVSTEATYSFAVTENITLTATFEAIPQYTITVSANDGEMGSVTGGGDYYEGATATLTATAKGGYVFEKWSDDNTDNPRTITVGEAVTYTAIFKVAPARVFAYNLDVVDNGDETYTLSFIPNANATSGRVILYNDDTKAQIHEETIAGTIAKGVKSEVIINKSVLPAAGIVTWAVELTGEPVEKVTLLTKANDKANYGFNRPQGVAIDNNPASDYFGRMYIALPKAGGTGYSDTNYGIVVMDPLHNRLKSGVVSNGDALGADGRYSMHRVAVNPTNGHVYYVRTSDSSEGVTGTAIYELAPDATNILTDGGTAKNVISGVGEITNANSVCFDETGAMYVMANANYDSGASLGRVYKVVDGVATLFTPNSIELASRDNAIVPDGKGGFWAAQHRDNFDTFSHLLHITATGTVDYSIDKNSADASLLPVQPYTSGGKDYTNASYRGQVAYYSIDENNGLVAYGGGAKVSVFKVSYDGAGKPSLTAWQTISLLTQSTKAGVNVDGIAFDYAGNIIVMSATDERMYQYALPIETANTSLVPSPISKAIKLGTIYNIEVAVNDPAMGTATGGGEYVEGETATLEASPAANHQFVNWTYGSETSTDNPLELVVNSDITVTANFAPVQYTLIAPTNDENKGTVTGAGTYDYGTDVEITATPKAGYKLLYWSDRSTENPRTITMTKNEAISAYFVKDYAEEPTFKIEKVWENTNVPVSTNNGYQAVGWDQKIYMKDRLNAVINVYTETSSELYAQLGSAVTNLAGDQPIAVDDAGNLIVRSGSGEFHKSPVQVTILKKGETTGKTIDFTLPATGRCDFISASGDIYSAKGGYVYFYCMNQTTISRLYIKNGGLTAADVSVDKVDNATLTTGSSQSHVFKNIFGDLMTHTRASTKLLQEVNVITGAVNTMSLPDFKESTLGGCSFELGGKELIAYNIKGTDYNSEWNLYNMTDGKFLSDETLYAKDRTSKKTSGAANWLNVQVVDENTAYIYQFCPEVAVAVWKVSIETPKYTREVTNGDYGTICLSYGSSSYSGAEFYEIAYLELEADGTTPKGIWLDEVTTLEAGKPYIFKATADELVVYYEGEEVLSPVEGKAGLTGTFDGITDENVLVGNYMIANNKFWLCGTGCWLNANRAYIEHDALHGNTTPISPMPGRRRVYMGGAGENSATGTEDMIVPNKQVQKIIENGQLIIIRDGVKYNVQGVRL